MTGSPGTLNAAERSAVLRWLSLAPDAVAPAHGDIRWDRVLDHVRVSLAPLVLRGIRSGPAEPPDVVAALRGIERQLATLYLRQRSVLRAVCTTLDDAAIPTIVLKGAALAHLVYPDPLLRPMNDLDLWIPPGRLEDAVGVLAPHGFVEPRKYAPGLSVASSFAGERVLVAREPNIAVELHTEVRSLAGLDCADFDLAWHAGRATVLGGVPARVLGPDHQLVHACLHLARKDTFESGLRHLVDVAMITRHWSGTWDWPRLERDWERQRVGVWAGLALTMARDLLGAPVPHDLEAGVGGSAWVAMRAIAEERLWEAGRHRLPPAITAVAGSAGHAATLSWLRYRLVDYYWWSPVPRPLLHVLRDGARRLWHDARVKVPTYVRRWLNGELRGEGFDRGLALERDRVELERLASAAGGSAGSPAAAPPSPADRAIAGGPSSG